MPELRQTSFVLMRNGARDHKLVIDVRNHTLPASYATGGDPVDLSATFRTIHAVFVNESVGTGHKLYAVQAGSDLYTAGRFRIMAVVAPGHTHSPTTNEHFLNATGAVSQAGHVAVSTALFAKGVCGALSCDGDSPQTTGSLSSVNGEIVRAAGTLAKVAAVTAIDTVGASALVEVGAGNDLSAVTAHVLVVGELV